jgi:hypothetical protein
MLKLRPADPSQESTELWGRVVERGRVDQRPDDDLVDALSRRVVRDLSARLGDDPGVAPLVAMVEADAADGYWRGARFQAERLGFDDDLARLISWLIGLKSTTGEAESDRFHAVGAAAAELAGGAMPPLDDRASAFYREHGELPRRYVAAQQAMTAEVLDGIGEVVLHRGEAIQGELPTSPANPDLWPLAPFATDFSTASNFAHDKVSRKRGGTAVVYSAIVPVERIAATPATGAANALEREVVVMAGNPDDRATLTKL